MRRQLSGRLFAAALALYVCASSLWSADSLIFALTATGGAPALVCMYALACLAIGAAADTVVNDVLPDRWSWACGVRYRQGLWMLIAVTYAGLGFVSLREPSGGWLAAYYWTCAAHCAAIAFVDLWCEHADRRRNRRAMDREPSHA